MLCLDEVEAGLRRLSGLDWRAEIVEAGIGADDLEVRRLSMFPGDVKSQPVVPLVADAETDKVRIAYILLNDLPVAGQTKFGLVWLC